MKVKVKKTNNDGIVKLETEGQIREILINEDFFHPKSESISICFRGKSSSGIIDFSPDEIEKIYKSVKGRSHLIKSVRIFKGESGI